MRVLHLFSDWKWTGPSEPVVNLCRTLQDFGLDVVLACRSPVEGYPVSLEKMARARGVKVTTGFRLNRYLSPKDTIADIWNLPRQLKKGQRYDLIHCHLSHDHFLGGWASRRSGIPIVRSNHKARPLERHLGNRWLLGKWTDGLIEFSSLAAQEDAKAFGFPEQRVLRVEGAVDLDRFRPEQSSVDVRPAIGVSPEEVLVGIVARVQRHRRFDLLLQAMAILAKRIPNVKLVVLGRGTYMEEVAVRPARMMGLQDKVIFPGYRSSDYVDYLRAIDIKVFLVPGSDGTCRAVREAMAMGKPVVATRRGMLGELVEDGKTGILVEEEPEMLARAIERLATDTVLRKEMGQAARAKALTDFSLKRQAAEVAQFYERIVALGSRAGRVVWARMSLQTWRE